MLSLVSSDEIVGIRFSRDLMVCSIGFDTLLFPGLRNRIPTYFILCKVPFFAGCFNYLLIVMLGCKLLFVMPC